MTLLLLLLLLDLYVLLDFISVPIRGICFYSILFIFTIGIIEGINIFKNANNHSTIVSSSGM